MVYIEEIIDEDMLDAVYGEYGCKAQILARGKATERHRPLGSGDAGRNAT